MIKKAAALIAGAVLLGGLAIAAFSRGSGGGSASPTAFDLPALHGPGRVRLAAYRGTPVVVTLYASWCTACETELPAFARAASGLRGRVQFIAVDSQETGDGAAYARRFGLADSGMVLARDVGLYSSYGAHGLPLTAFYGTDGRILWKANAALPENVLQQQLSKLYGT